MRSGKEYLKNSLKDCGFGKDTAEQYLNYAEENHTSDMLRLLNQQRKKLMDDLHTAQRRVDTIDFMIRLVEQKEGKGGGI